MNQCAVNAPVGSAGNHIRWLMLLDSKFSMQLISADIAVIEFNSLSVALENLPDHVVCPFDTIKNKVNFINTHVYHNDRSWHNWLHIEWRFRKQLDSVINFDHNFQNISSQVKTVALTVDPEIAYKHYVKFNCNLNNNSKKLFMKSIDYNNYHVNQHKNNPMVLVIDSNLLFDPVLNKNIYNSIIEFCELDDHYFIAQDIHTRWINLNKKSEIDIVKDFQKLYNKN
jgi:hypothetical protein